MKKLTKANQLRLVRTVVRELTPSHLASVVGGQTNQHTCNTSCNQDNRSNPTTTATNGGG